MSLETDCSPQPLGGRNKSWEGKKQAIYFTKSIPVVEN